MLGMFLTKDGDVFIKGRSVKNKPSDPITNHVSLAKAKYMRNVIHAYATISFRDFNIVDLSELSLKEWVNRKYPIPKGYVMRYGMKGTHFKKITLEQELRNLFFNRNTDQKSHPFVK